MINLASRLKYGWQLGVSVRNMLWSTSAIAKYSIDSSRRLAYAEPWPTKNMPQLATLRNGEKARGTFSEVEMDRRISKLRKEMENKNINGVLFTSHHNINYYSDFMYCEVGRPYGLVVTHDKIVSISANVDGGYPWRRTVNGDNLVYTDWQRDNFFTGVNHELGELKGKIGCEFDHISLDSYNKLHNALPESKLVDIAESTMYLRMIKSDEEIAHITEGARIAEIGGGAVIEALAEGVSEHEIALHSTQAMVREIAKSRPDIALQDTWTWFQSGINSDGAHNPVTSRKVQKGDICILNCFPMMAGYFAGLERTLFLDHASDEALRIWEANCEVHEAGIKLVKPGIKCKEIAQKLNMIYEKHDLLQYRTFGYGHSFGVLCHYYGREAALELREDIETVLQPNMVLSMEPMVMLPDGQPGAGGYREHDILVVTKDGAKTLTHFPYGPEHMIIKK
ncbi:creatinase-like [Anneissia japonica]|uniref:creatinase-like n=1 Tax=Anneissia japonica TaxID=1529436 RepID=UPI0014259717|nr:creatinase-like [Anneissia japonica]XP_033108865.1 creatinase-like [Anneissia japonica]